MDRNNNMKKFIVILSLLFSIFAVANEVAQEESKPTIRMFNKHDEEVKVSTCEEFIRYKLDNYLVRGYQYDTGMKGRYHGCSDYGKDIQEEEAKQILDMIYNNILNVPLPPLWNGKTPKELELIINYTENKIDGYAFISEYPDPEFPEDKPDYGGIILHKKISENLYLVNVVVDFTIGTYISNDLYLFNPETKEYYLFYHPSVLAFDGYDHFMGREIEK